MTVHNLQKADNLLYEYRVAIHAPIQEARSSDTEGNSGSSRFSVANLKWLGAVGGHGDGEFAGDEVEHVDEVEGGAVAASLALDG